MIRRQEIELIRIFSAFGIVWFHTASIGKDFGYSGLIVFLIISAFFSASPSKNKKPLLEKVRRLIIPWMAWFLFYGFLNVFMKKPFVDLHDGAVSGILVGTSIHLWYLPFIFFVAVAVESIKRQVTPEQMAYVSAALIVCFFYFAEFWRSLSLTNPWEQYIHAFGGVLVGVYFANCSFVNKYINILFLFVCTILTISLFSIPGIGIPYFIGITVCEIAILPTWRIPSFVDFSRITDCTLGIYLSHPFWYLLLYKIHIKDPLIMPFAVFFMSLVSVLLLKFIMPKLSRYVV